MRASRLESSGIERSKLKNPRGKLRKCGRHVLVLVYFPKRADCPKPLYLSATASGLFAFLGTPSSGDRHVTPQGIWAACEPNELNPHLFEQPAENVISMPSVETFCERSWMPSLKMPSFRGGSIAIWGYRAKHIHRLLPSHDPKAVVFSKPVHILASIHRATTGRECCSNGLF